MRVDEFDFNLPENLIALRPENPRDAARLLVVQPGRTPELTDSVARDLGDWLLPGDMLVFNETKVIPAQLFGVRAPRDVSNLGTRPSLGGPKIDVTLHKRAGPNTWWAFARPAKKLELGDHISFGHELGAQVKHKQGGEIVIAFDQEGAALDSAIAGAGVMPLPPYIARKRAADRRDEEDYQTIYAKREGSVAAPTAGLHFTDDLLDRLLDLGVTQERVTLHVGAGTFLPMKVDDTRDHVMHAEWGEVSAQTVDAISEAKARGGRIIPVGTTSLRLLESAARETGSIQPFQGDTDIFITPGFEFCVADGLMTNFHLPRSTLFMLVSALSGLDVMKRAYTHAITQKYRFYSYNVGLRSLLRAETSAMTLFRPSAVCSRTDCPKTRLKPLVSISIKPDLGAFVPLT
jgi:S-adenosylmethionine:tRNA ribosyltransferase-isomerase